MPDGVYPNPCTNCNRSWVSGRACDCGDFCEDIKAYVVYRNTIAGLMRQGMSQEDAIRQANERLGRE